MSKITLLIAEKKERKKKQTKECISRMKVRETLTTYFPLYNIGSRPRNKKPERGEKTRANDGDREQERERGKISSLKFPELPPRFIETL